MYGIRSQDSSPFGDGNVEEQAVGSFGSAGDALDLDLGLVTQMCSFSNIQQALMACALSYVYVIFQ